MSLSVTFVCRFWGQNQCHPCLATSTQSTELYPRPYHRLSSFVIMDGNFLSQNIVGVDKNRSGFSYWKMEMCASFSAHGEPCSWKYPLLFNNPFSSKLKLEVLKVISTSSNATQPTPSCAFFPLEMMMPLLVPHHPGCTSQHLHQFPPPDISKVAFTFI